METPTMIYQPGKMAISYGVSYDYKIVDAGEVGDCLKDGWYSHYYDFPKESPKNDSYERDGLQKRADAFGVDLDMRKTVKKLTAQVEELEASKV
jgi:hypothetical protein